MCNRLIGMNTRPHYHDVEFNSSIKFDHSVFQSIKIIYLTAAVNCNYGKHLPIMSSNIKLLRVGE